MSPEPTVMAATLTVEVSRVIPGLAPESENERFPVPRLAVKSEEVSALPAVVVNVIAPLVAPE